MDIHKNARLTLLGREALVKRVLEHQVTLNSAAAEFNVSPRTAAKWVLRFRSEGHAGLADRSSRPRQLRQPTPLYLVQQVEQLRRQRWAGARIATHTQLSPATVSRILRRLKLNRIRHLEPAPPIQRYEHAAPGDLLHLDIKKLGRFRAPGHRIHHHQSRRTRHVGFDFVHVAVDDHSRIAFAQILPNEQAVSAAAFLAAAISYYQRLGIRIQRVLTDNGPCYHSLAFRLICQQHGIRHRFTRPYTPRTNGKAERFIQTALREWAYARSYDTSDQRGNHLLPWLHQYNWHRPHASLKASPPISRSGLDPNNLLIHHS